MAFSTQLRRSSPGGHPHRADITSIDEKTLWPSFSYQRHSANPKGVMLTHRNIYFMRNVCLGFNIENGAVELHTISTLPANGWGVAHFLTLLGGKTS